MADDPRIQWHLANAYGIWAKSFDPGDPESIWDTSHFDSPADAWHSGRATDVLIRPDGYLVVASDRGGIWLMSDSWPGTICVSNSWEDVEFLALAQGPDNDLQLFAGGVGAALKMTDLSSPGPLSSWILLQSLRDQFPGAGTIYDIAILRGARVIVLACDLGVLWARISPPPSPLLPVVPDGFLWHQAVMDDGLLGGFYRVAVGPTPPGRQSGPRGPIVDTIMAAGLGAGQGPGGLYWGEWKGPDLLVLFRSHLFDLGADVTIIDAALGRSALASFAPDPRTGYAVCGNPGSDTVLSVFKTTDGGRNWNALPDRVMGPGPPIEIAVAMENGVHHGQLTHNLCIAVSNTDPDIVAIGLCNGALSFDGGAHWQLPGYDITVDTNTKGPRADPSSDHLHQDLVNITFALPTHTQPVAQESFLVTSDGGVSQVSWGAGAWVIESHVSDGGTHGDLYAVVLEGNSLVLYVRYAGDPSRKWQQESVVTDRAISAGCIIQSGLGSDDPEDGNLEVVVLEAKGLVHYACPKEDGHYTNWTDRKNPDVVSGFAAGPGCIIQSTFGTGDHGNFEVVVLEGSELVHYWHDNNAPGSPWQRGAVISTRATGPGCIIQSDYPDGRYEGIWK
jgi:hypothetical protein